MLTHGHLRSLPVTAVRAPLVHFLGNLLSLSDLPAIYVSLYPVQDPYQLALLFPSFVASEGREKKVGTKARMVNRYPS